MHTGASPEMAMFADSDFHMTHSKDKTIYTDWERLWGVHSPTARLFRRIGPGRPIYWYESEAKRRKVIADKKRSDRMHRPWIGMFI